jgi:beta-N-acetylhexosaminidase
MGYDGVVITDSLGMQGVRTKYGDDRVPVLALKAGVDMLLMPPNLDLAYNAVLDAVRNGELTEARLDVSVRRILRLKWNRCIVQNPYVDVANVPHVVGTPEHLEAANEITDHTTTLVKNDGVLPLQPDSGKSVLVTGWGVSPTRRVADELAERGLPTQVIQTGTSPSQAAIDNAADAANTHDLVVVVTYRTHLAEYAAQRDLVRRLIATGTPVIAVAARDAYDVRYFPDVNAYLATYGYGGVSLDALGRVLFGEVNPVGKLPVTIPSVDDPATPLYDYGHGLSY